MIGVPSRLSLIRKGTALARVLTTLDLNCEENDARCGGSERVHCWIAQAELFNLQKSGQFPDESVRTKDAQIHYVTSQTYYQYQV